MAKEYRSALALKQVVKAEAKIPDRWLGVKDAERVVKKCVSPAIRRQAEGLEWNPEALEWAPARPSKG